jgi:hypothetical protein
MFVLREVREQRDTTIPMRYDSNHIVGFGVMRKEKRGGMREKRKEEE